MPNRPSDEKSRGDGPPEIIEFEPPPEDVALKKMIEAAKKGDRKAFEAALNEFQDALPPEHRAVDKDNR